MTVLATLLSPPKQARILQVRIASKRCSCSPPPPDVDRVYGGRVLLRLPPMLHGSLDRAAVAQGVSLNQYPGSLLSLAHLQNDAFWCAT